MFFYGFIGIVLRDPRGLTLGTQNKLLYKVAWVMRSEDAIPLSPARLSKKKNTNPSLLGKGDLVLTPCLFSSFGNTRCSCRPNIT